MRNSLILTRRHFMAGSAALCALAAPVLSKVVPAKTRSPLNLWPGRCVVNYDNRHGCTATGGSEVDMKAVQAMVDASITLLTDTRNTGDAWKRLFPSLTMKTRIALKVNILNPVVPPHPYIVRAIVEGLKQMRIDGTLFPAAQITIFDGNNRSAFASAGYLPELFPGVTLVKHLKGDLVDYGDGAHGNQPYARPLNECDYLINVPGLRGHDDYAGHVTLGFKSHYGSYPPLYHDMENGPGFLRDINCTGPVFKKTALTVVGALFGLKEGKGPKGDADSYLDYAKKIAPGTENPAPNTIVMSTDPVTAEVQAIRIMRMRENKPFDTDSMPHYLKASAGISGVLEPTYDIGVIDPAGMDVRRMVNGAKA